MILVDVNLLLYAIDEDAPHHRAARRWWEETLSGTRPVGLAWVVLLAFVRLTTRQGILVRPLPPDQALAFVEEWLDHPLVEAVSPGRGHWRILRSLLAAAGTAGNLTTDAHLAALALEQGAEVYSADHDFARFAGVTQVDPLSAAE